MRNVTIVVDDEQPDTMATAAARLLRRHADVETIGLSSFLKSAGFSFDVLSGLLVRDPAAYAEFVAASSQVLLLNRVVEIRRPTCAAFLEGTGLGPEALPARFLLAAYASLFSTMKSVLGTPGRYSAVGHLLPLDLQWHEVASRRRDIGVPRYSYSQFEARPVDFERPIWTTPYELFNWKINASPELTSLHPFVVERPLGDPAVVYFVANEAAAFSLTEERRLTDGERGELMSLVPTLRDAFGTAMGESLCFLHEGRVTFASFSHYLYTSAQRKKFDGVLERGLCGWLGEEAREVAVS